MSLPLPAGEDINYSSPSFHSGGIAEPCPRCLRVAETAKDSFGQCVAIGVTGILFFQSFVNIGMNMGIMPVTGITLPFVSQGSSSLWTFLMAQGILQSILMRHRKLAFQQVDRLERTTWPEHDVPMQMHVDFTVASIDELARHRDRALALGARILLDRTDDDDEPLYVLADPSGHPFCLFVA